MDRKPKMMSSDDQASPNLSNALLINNYDSSGGLKKKPAESMPIIQSAREQRNDQGVFLSPSNSNNFFMLNKVSQCLGHSYNGGLQSTEGPLKHEHQSSYPQQKPLASQTQQNSSSFLDQSGGGNIGDDKLLDFRVSSQRATDYIQKGVDGLLGEKLSAASAIYSKQMIKQQQLLEYKRKIQEQIQQTESNKNLQAQNEAESKDMPEIAQIYSSDRMPGQEDKVQQNQLGKLKNFSYVHPADQLALHQQKQQKSSRNYNNLTSSQQKDKNDSSIKEALQVLQITSKNNEYLTTSASHLNLLPMISPHIQHQEQQLNITSSIKHLKRQRQNKSSQSKQHRNSKKHSANSKSHQRQSKDGGLYNTNNGQNRGNTIVHQRSEQNNNVAFIRNDARDMTGERAAASMHQSFNMVLGSNGQTELIPNVNKQYYNSNNGQMQKKPNQLQHGGSSDNKALHTLIASQNDSNSNNHVLSMLQNHQPVVTNTTNSSSFQKRVQSTEPRLFSHKPQIAELSKSNFLQPIFSQKTLNAAAQVSQQNHHMVPQTNSNTANTSATTTTTTTMSQHGKQVMANMLKHQQQASLKHAGGNEIMVQPTGPPNAHQLPKFLTQKVNQRTSALQQQQQAQQQAANSVPPNQIAGGALEAFIQQQHFLQMQKAGKLSNKNSSHNVGNIAKAAHNTASIGQSQLQQQSSAPVGIPPAQHQQTQQKPNSGQGAPPTLPQNVSYSRGAANGGSYQLQLPAPSTTSAKTEAALSQTNILPQQAGSTPIQNYLMQIQHHASNSNGAVAAKNNSKSNHQYVTVSIQRSASNSVIAQFKNPQVVKRAESLSFGTGNNGASGGGIKGMVVGGNVAMASDVAQAYHSNQMPGKPPKSQIIMASSQNSASVQQHNRMMQQVLHSGGSGKQSPGLVILGQSPSNSRLLVHSNAGSQVQQQQQQFLAPVQLRGSNGVNPGSKQQQLQQIAAPQQDAQSPPAFQSLGKNFQHNFVHSGLVANPPPPQGAAAAAFVQIQKQMQFQQYVQLTNGGQQKVHQQQYQLDIQQPPQPQMSQYQSNQIAQQQLFLNGPQNQLQIAQQNNWHLFQLQQMQRQQQMAMTDDDGGIDERFDGDDDSVEEQELMNDEQMSPKANKPRPLDQTFIPQKGQKYFSVVIGYPAMRRALRARGWIEVKCYKKLASIIALQNSANLAGTSGLESTINRQFDGNLDLKFVLSAQDANHNNLKKSCLINQNRGEGNLTCKSGLKESLMRSFVNMGCWYPMEHCDPLGVGPESFFPRSHVLDDPEALAEFQRDFVLTEAENYLRKYIRKFKEFKEKGIKAPKPTPVRAKGSAGPPDLKSNKRSPSKKAVNKSKDVKKNSISQLSSHEASPVKDAPLTDGGETNTTTILQEPANVTITNLPCTLENLGFLKEKLLVCCNIVGNRLKPVDHKLDKKKGIMTDRITAGEITMEERSFLLRSKKQLSTAYLKYIRNEEWYCKAFQSFPQFKKDKNLPTNQQQETMCEKIDEICKSLINQLKESYPQTELNGYDNMWIVKPGGLSRGRKIRIFKDFQKILTYAEVDHAQQITANTGLVSATNPSGANTQFYMGNTNKPAEEMNIYTKKVWVIQKYIENPMLIMNRKFDIRVWVVIPTWNPLRIYIFKECYFRFSGLDYDPRQPSNLFSHLTNNSVIKKCAENAKQIKKIPGNMWSLGQFKEYLGGKDPVVISQLYKQQNGKGKKEFEAESPLRHATEASDILKKDMAEEDDEDMASPEQPDNAEVEESQEDQQYRQDGEKIWNEKYYPQAKEIIVQSILSAWDKIEWRKGGIGVYGFDLFPDENGKLWLLEINKCPTMEYSTAVTRKLVPRFLEDLTELIIDKRKGNHPFAGGLEKVYDVPKLRDLTDFQQTQKDLKIDGKGIDAINNSNYLHALHRNKRKPAASASNSKPQNN